MKIPALGIFQGRVFHCPKQPSEFLSASQAVMRELSLNEETHDVVKASWASVRLEGVEPGFIDPKIINQTLYNFSDFIP